MADRLGAGLHLRGGYRCRASPPNGRVVTSSAHSIPELRRAAAAGAGVVFLSPAFATASHVGSRCLGRSVGALRGERECRGKCGCRRLGASREGMSADSRVLRRGGGYRSLGVIAAPRPLWRRRHSVSRLPCDMRTTRCGCVGPWSICASGLAAHRGARPSVSAGSRRRNEED